MEWQLRIGEPCGIHVRFGFCFGRNHNIVAVKGPPDGSATLGTSQFVDDETGRRRAKTQRQQGQTPYRELGWCERHVSFASRYRRTAPSNCKPTAPKISICPVESCHMRKK